jgi:hypothetical protein
MALLTPEEFKERNPSAAPAAVAAYATFYGAVGKGYVETKASPDRFEEDGGWGGYV